jgi:hypothetical protein
MAYVTYHSDVSLTLKGTCIPVFYVNVNENILKATVLSKQTHFSVSMMYLSLKRIAQRLS